jgi:hypothetical protein
LHISVDPKDPDWLDQQVQQEQKPQVNKELFLHQGATFVGLDQPFITGLTKKFRYLA